ncbi:hypothetical protein LB523_17465 [Mesorhizobium sp. ESP-6-4]|uniref:hypothetical protein n=1 Tax=Mesorhizobium sp. ESP-6-4 TaxID=2876624 RepID=UPI001CCDEEF0|nr:hypothetical protein [Mesorhizobium sp. ESP-6-4]MBZ9660841.1 hypothetical protein [Mesorhizobium sp. ESP-6-4]
MSGLPKGVGSNTTRSDFIRSSHGVDIRIVLVHGGFVDGSGREGVYHELKKDGHEVIIAQSPTTSLVDDVAVTKHAIADAKHDSSSSTVPTAAW